jgi:RNA recognition motif-containing protein
MTKLFVHIAGIDNNLEKADRIAFLQKMFSDVYQIKEENIILINDKKYGGYRNFQFAEIEDEETANKIIEALNGTTYEGYEIAINIAKPLEESDRRPSFNRGGNSGGGFNRGGGSFGGGSNRSDRPTRSYNDDSRGYRN